jgi:hypothetical protein
MFDAALDDTRDLITGIETKRDTPVESLDTMSEGLHAKSRPRSSCLKSWIGRQQQSNRRGFRPDTLSVPTGSASDLLL